MDYDLLGILTVIIILVVCLAPDIREIVLVISVCMNAIHFTNELRKAHTKRIKKESLIVKNIHYHPHPHPHPHPHSTPIVSGEPLQSFENYPGRINFDEPPPAEKYSQGNDRIAHAQLVRPGVDYVRQINGAMQRKKAINPYVKNDCDTDEYRDWWSKYDY